ncbi:UDP-N-acetylmuramoyl-tripeptide--D-alanyl-D-alanine ligase [Mesonia phycicola]|uniref:UDP-N-acetylmuramoyl-tripeptide--D-alanyl-D-alanine ligase n=1 Tax=Mesonia phycicola TaxID=579105 RepID=A0A1M6H3Y2_9FLAO|nr:UDP-N-acetylmuramoyl-tripeptide--D-alanyl-D-alanine ligase [Mesonia phycicola]SHJ16875.1 UDP-N-acetylmuramoyl-tripeptide--D-alanyl-D-alanine ligase [Mesonia phycicola]
MKNIERLHNIFLQSTGICTDTRKLKEGNLFIALKGDNFDGNKYVDFAIKNNAIHAVTDNDKSKDTNHITIVKDGLKTLQDLACYHRKFLNIPIVAITGSNGKTTTKELIREVLNQKYRTTSTIGNLNNHIGVPLTLLSMNNKTEIGIVEMGANHQGEIKMLCQIAKPDYGYITNFGKAHLEGFGGIEGVIKGKSELYNYLIENNKRIFINYDDELQINKTKQADVISFSEGNDATYQITFLKASPYIQIATKDININSQLIGTYNAKNIASAICIGLYFKVNPKSIKKAIEKYQPNNNRSQIINKNTNQIILDAYNANPTSMQAALENIKTIEASNKTVILGDMFEVGSTSKEEHQNIVNLLEKLSFKNMYICGNHFYECSTNTVKKFKEFSQLSEYIDQHKIENNTILIKGSRGMALERILDHL